MNRGYWWQINMANFQQRSDSWACVHADTTLYNCVANGRRSLANRCTAPGARICASCHKSSRVARLALLPSRIANSGLGLFTHAGKSYACACFWRTVMAPRFLFGFQHCREGVRALSGAGMGLSENPELIATHNALCVSSWRGHMPPVGSSYSQQSSHRRVSGRSRSRACLSTSWRLLLSASCACWRAWLSRRAFAAKSESLCHA